MATTAKVWDEVWQTAASGKLITSLREYYSSRLRNLITPHIDQTSRVLELGCGTATLLLSLAPRVKDVIGLDISPEGLKIARGHQQEHDVTNARFVQADCRYVPFQDEFDVVYSAGLIEHFFDNDIAIVQQHIKAAKPGGKIIMSVPYKYTLHGLHYLLTRPNLMRPLWPWSQERYFQKFYSLHDLKQLAQQMRLSHRVYFLRPWPIGLLLGIAVVEIDKPPV